MAKSAYPLQLEVEEFRTVVAQARLEHLMIFSEILDHQVARIIEMFDVLKAELEWRLLLNSLMRGSKE